MIWGRIKSIFIDSLTAKNQRLKIQKREMNTRDKPSGRRGDRRNCSPLERVSLEAERTNFRSVSSSRKTLYGHFMLWGLEFHKCIQNHLTFFVNIVPSNLLTFNIFCYDPQKGRFYAMTPKTLIHTKVDNLYKSFTKLIPNICLYYVSCPEIDCILFHFI